MRLYLLMTIPVVFCMAGYGRAQDQIMPSEGWKYFDYDGEETGWENTNSDGNSIDIIDCEFAENKGYYRFFSVGLFNEYLSNKDTRYWLNANDGDNHYGEIYVSTPGGYYEYVYNFAVDAKTVLNEEAIKLCVRAFDDNSSGRCFSFSGANFRKVFANLCVAKTPGFGPESREDIVRAFYLALETGNGPEASALVVPEKRTTGPFSAPELSSYYGSLKKPLRLISVTRVGEYDFRVRYTFETESRKVCDGRSFVTVREVNGHNLIAKIRAESGC